MEPTLTGSYRLPELRRAIAKPSDHLDLADLATVPASMLPTS
jgi:hypothetical protein